MDGVRLLELIEEYRAAKDDEKWSRALDVREGRPVTEIAADVEATVRAILG